MHKKFEINQTKIKGGCQSGRKIVTHNSKSDLPLVRSYQKMDIDSLESRFSISLFNGISRYRRQKLVTIFIKKYLLT